MDYIYKSEIFKNYISGYISGISAIVISHPIDTIKTNYQEKKPIKLNIKNLYKGITAPLIGIGLEKALVFGTYDSTYKYTNSYAISGAVSGLTASFIVTPYERIKILYQSNNNKINKSTLTNNLNIKYLYQGFSATIYREVPGFAIYFSIYNYCKNKIQDTYSRNITLYESFMLGGFAGAYSWIFIYPQDRIKTHMQSSINKINLRLAIKDIINDGGIKGLYRGFSLALLRAIPLHATAFMVNEKCKEILYIDL